MSTHPHPADPDQVAEARAAGLTDAEAQSIGALLSLLADPVRARILAALAATKELCVGDLALAVDATEDAVSYALRILRTAGLVENRRDGRMRYYRLHDGPARQALADTIDTVRRLAGLHPENGQEDDE